MFIFIVAASAFFIAACAAFFSIKGLMVLFAGSAFSVAVMASSLELGKLVAASFLHRNWKTSSFFLKIYLTIAVGVLMFITSLGIFGFLTNAYQIHKGKVAVYQTDLASLEVQQKSINDELTTNQERIVSLQELRKEQEARVNAAGNYKAPREQAYKAIETANQEMQAKEARQVELRTELSQLEIKKAEITKELNTKTDIGSFQFIADALGTDVDTAVKYFILSMVFVFDPLAVALVLALNQLFELRELKKRTHKDRETKLREQAYFHEDSSTEVKEKKSEIVAEKIAATVEQIKEEIAAAVEPVKEVEKPKKLAFVKIDRPMVTGMSPEEKELYAQQQKETEK